MKAYKAPTFAERQAAAAAARDNALAKLKAKAPPDPATVQARVEAAERKRVAAEEKRAAKLAEREAAKAEAAALAEAGKKPVPSEADRKAERDSRYAARKARKK